MKNNISSHSMDKNSLKKLSKSELIRLLLKQQSNKSTQRRPVPTPRKSVNQMVQDYEKNIITPPIPAPRSKKPVPAPRTKKPVPAPRTKIEQTAKALKGYTKSYEINVKNEKDPLIQLNNTRKAVAKHIENILTSMKGLKFAETLRVTFEKQTGREERIIKTAYFNSKPQTITNDKQIELALSLSKQEILNYVAVWISEGSGWAIESIDDHYLNVVKYEPMKGSSYIKEAHNSF